VTTLISWRYLGGGRLEDQVLSMLRGQITNIIAGAVFLFMGSAACSIAAIRWRSGVRLFIWLGIWSAMCGTGLLARSPAVVAALPHTFQSLIVSFMTATKAIMPRNGTNSVDLTPSTLFFFTLVCRKAISCWSLSQCWS
jgi:hypothetical protein